MSTSVAVATADVAHAARERSKTASESRLRDYSERDRKWDHHRSNTQGVENIYADNSDFERLAERMHDCSTLLAMRWTQPDADGETRLKLGGATFCHVRHCPVCQWRRSMKNVARFFTKMPELQAAHPTARWLFLTLTVPNCEYKDLRATVKAMNAGWKRLIERKDWPAIGWLRTVEVTREQVRHGYAHPHFHALLMVPAGYFSRGYVTQSAWLDRWQNAMRDDTIQVVDVRAVKPKIPGQDLQAAVV